MRRDRRELALVGRLAAEADQLHATYRDRGAMRPAGLAAAITGYVTRDQGQRPTISTEEAEALIHEAALVGLLIGVKIGRTA